MWAQLIDVVPLEVLEVTVEGSAGTDSEDVDGGAGTCGLVAKTAKVHVPQVKRSGSPMLLFESVDADEEGFSRVRRDSGLLLPGRPDQVNFSQSIGSGPTPGVVAPLLAASREGGVEMSQR